MPGGGGGGRAGPPDMRLRRERRGGAVVYVDGPPRSPFWRWARKLGAFAGLSFLLGLAFLFVGSAILGAAGRRSESAAWLFPASWALGAAVAFRLILLGPARSELEPRPKEQALVFRRVYLWGPPRERRHGRPEVEAVALLDRDHGGPYLELKLALADGRTVFVEHGKEKDRMRELARDVGGALGLPVTPIPAPASAQPFGGSLTRLALASGEVRWVDFDAGARLIGTWAVCLASVLFGAAGLFGLVGVAAEWWSGPPAAPPVVALTFLAVLAAACAVGFTAAVVCLRRPRYRGLRPSPEAEGRVIFQRLGIFGGRREQTLSVGSAAAVVLVRDRKRDPRQVWLEGPAGERLYIDGGKGKELARLAADLARPLRVPVRGVDRSFFLV